MKKIILSAIAALSLITTPVMALQYWDVVEYDTGITTAYEAESNMCFLYVFGEDNHMMYSIAPGAEMGGIGMTVSRQFSNKDANIFVIDEFGNGVFSEIVRVSPDDNARKDFVMGLVPLKSFIGVITDTDEFEFFVGNDKAERVETNYFYAGDMNYAVMDLLDCYHHYGN